MKLKRNELQPEDFADWRASNKTKSGMAGPVDLLPDHQIDRGPRHGNNRHMYAKLKLTNRRRDRAIEKRQLQKDFE